MGRGNSSGRKLSWKDSRVPKVAWGSRPHPPSIYERIQMRDPMRNVMNAIKMDRTELLNIVRANKVKHAEEFLESVADYKAAVLKIATSNAKVAKTQILENFKHIKGMPTTPVSYEDSYHRAIRMLELSVENFIEVEENVFNQLVLDEWNWKNHFIATSALYKSF